VSKVFLSHNHADKPFVRKLAADLRQAGHTVWIDEAEIKIGDSLIDKIREGLDQVDLVIAVLSEASIGSPWVERELDIASNREIEEKRVVVLPLLRQKVALPGFLKGKLYGDFTDDSRYQESFEVLLRSLGPVDALPSPVPVEDIAALRAELAQVRESLAAQTEAIKAHERIALRDKSPALAAAIEQSNLRHPAHAPINNTYAFEAGESVITLDYLLWAIAKAGRKGGHPLDFLLTHYGKWGDVERMLDAYDDLLASYQESGAE
jgi:hypothetical protein